LNSEKDAIYTLLRDAYFGSGQFEGGGALVRHERESDGNYAKRRRLAYYLNYTGPIVNASVDPIFRNEIAREYNDTAKFKVFLDDADRTGADLQNYIRRMAVAAKLYGVVYIVVNNEASIGETVQDNLDMRALPYLTAVLPQNVTHWKFDERGRLIEFAYKDTVKDAEDKTRVRFYLWTQNEWQVQDENQQTIAQGDNNIGRVPVVQWFGRSTDPMEMLPSPEFLSVAQTNYHVYQLCSWHTQILQNQTFNILTLPSGGEEDITIGTNNVLTYPPESTHTPAFIAPDAAPANVLTDQIDRLIREMYRMSGLDSVIGVQTAKSGVARQWDFERTNQRLVDFAIQCEEAEKAIVALYEAWTGEQINYTCEYPRDFKIADVAADLQEAQQAIDLGFDSKSFRVEVARKVLAAYLPNIEPDVYDAVISELEAAADTVTRVEEYGDESDGDKSAGAKV
jgi:hypothetical protein